ncbi:hypothetical protein PLICRDRAFT_53057 [Plicaturopsis crispa FD-325 SS-3]|nr:hypothetical protein PLICRDRAFT_53057 [Plicaturopsis crispa FD-325 SS-3]
MHKCLQVLDILALIFAEVAADDNAQSRATLAGLARSCHAFEDVALDHLWRKLRSVLPLLRCIGPDLWIESPEPYAQSHMELKRPIRREDWQRCQKYADRVKTLEIQFGWAKDPQLEVATIYSLLASAPTTAMLPNLHTLEYPYNDNTLFPVHLLVGPRLRILKTSFSDTSREPSIGQSIVPSLPPMCPSLVRFTFDDYKDRVPPDLIADIVSQWDSLEVLELDTLTEVGVSQLSHRLLKLPSFSFSYPEEAQSCDAWHQSVLRFPMLRTLSIRMQSFQCILAECDTFFMVMEAPRLTAIQFIFNYHLCPQSIVHDFLVALRKHLSITSVVVRSDLTDVGEIDEEDGRSPENALHCTTMQPLFSFQHLTTFCWECIDGFDMDDGDLEMLASAWPSLTALDLSSSCGWTVPSRITLKGVAKLIQLCPGLESLGLVIDATVVDPLESYSEPIVPNHALTAISLGSSPVDDASAVAAVLGAIFPSLCALDAWGEWADFELFDPRAAKELRRRWSTVEALLSERAATAMET